MSVGRAFNRFARHHREALIGASVLFVLINLTLFPFIWGNLTLEDSTNEAASLYLSGSRSPVVAVSQLRTLDPGAAAWMLEPAFPLEHRIVGSERTFPIWNPYVGYGLPLAADMQSQPYSPFAWLPAISPTPRLFNLFVALRIYLGGFFAFLFVRLFVARLPSLVSGASWMYAGYSWLYLTMPELSVGVLIPGLLYAMERVLRRPSFFNAALLSGMLACVILGGMPELTTLTLVFAYLYWTVRAFGSDVVRQNIREVASMTAVATAVGIGLSGILLVPFLEYMPISFNAHTIVTTTGIAHDQFRTGFAAQYLAPFMYGIPWNSVFAPHSHSGVRGFFAASEVCFALVAVFARIDDIIRRRPAGQLPILFFFFVALGLLTRRFGLPLVNWIGLLPVLRLVLFVKYEEAVIACCVAVLAGAGVARILDRSVPRVAAWFAVVSPLFLLTVAAGMDKTFILSLSPDLQIFNLASLACAVLFLGLAGALLVVSRLQGSGRFALGACALALVVVEVHAEFIVPNLYLLSKEADKSTSALYGAPYVDFLRQHSSPESRIFATDYLVFPNWSGVFGVYDVRALDALYPRRYLEFVRALIPAAMEPQSDNRFIGENEDLTDEMVRRLLTMSSVRYVATLRPVESNLLIESMRSHAALASPGLYSGAFNVGGVVKPGLFMHPPQPDYKIRVRVPSDATNLAFSIGLLPRAWTSPTCGDGVNFSIRVGTPEGVRRLYHHYIDPKHTVSERHWFDELVGIEAYRGRTVDLLLSTRVGPSGSTCMDWAVWGDLRILPSAPETGPFHLVFEQPGARIYEYRGALPRVALFRSVRRAASEASAIGLIRSPSFDPLSEAIVEGDEPGLAALTAEPRAAALPGRLDVYESTYVRALVNAVRPSLVVLNDTSYPGWSARVDGRTVPILTTNYLFRGVLVGEGKHVVEFSYRPASFLIGLCLTVLSLAALIVLLVLSRYPRERTLKTKSPPGGSEGWD